MKIETVVKRIDAYTHKINQEFEKATPAKKRVMVLKDALLQLSNKKYKATSGTYFEFDLKEDVIKKGGALMHEEDLIGHLGARTQVSALIDLPVMTCNVCAIGGAFASLTRIRDRVDACDVNLATGSSDWEDFEEYIEQVFSHSLLSLMEEAFERSNYGYEFDTNDQCLKEIYKNIIKNEGKSFTSFKDMYFAHPTTGDAQDYPKGTIIWSEK